MITILIVNNHGNKFAELSRLFVCFYGKCEMLSAMSASDAMRMAQLKIPNVIVLQSDLSNSDRSNLCERLKNNRQTRDIPVILIISKDTDQAVLEQSLNEGVIGFLREPVSMIEFASLIKIAFRMKKAEDQLLEQRFLDEEIAEARIKDLRIVEDKYCKIFNSGNDIVLIYDVTMDGLPGKIIDANEFACTKLGWDKLEILGTSPFDFFDGKFCMSIPKFMEKILKKKTVVFEAIHKTKNEASFPVEVKADLLEVHESKFILSVAKDLTEKKSVEDKLHKSEERYRIIAEKTGYAVYDYDLDKEKIQWSGSIRTITGYKHNEFRKFSLNDLKKLIHKEDIEYVMSILDKAVKTFSNYQIEHRLKTKNGDYIYIENSGVFVKNAKPYRILGVVKNISERKQAERELIKKRKLESLGLLAGGIAHDFNNLLTAILGNISLAKMEADPEKDIFESLVCAEKASMMAKDLSMQLLTFSKGGVPIRKTASIEEIIRDSARFALKGSNVKCDISVENKLSPVEIDVGQINQVLNNLIINASQAMPDGGIISIVCESVSVSKRDKLHLKKGKYIRIKISDTGFGISKEVLEKIFDPYFTTKNTGSGLGLSITYSIVKKHDGHIDVESKSGVGTVFTIYFPVSSNKLEKGNSQKDEVVCGQGRILIMDDEEIVRNVASRILTRLGYKVDFAVNGCEAIEKYKAALKTNYPFNAVIMDLTIPGGMGGKDAIRELLKIDPNVKAIVASGYSNDPVIANFKEYFFCDVIAKPYNAKELSKVLGQVLRSR